MLPIFANGAATAAFSAALSADWNSSSSHEAHASGLRGGESDPELVGPAYESKDGLLEVAKGQLSGKSFGKGLDGWRAATEALHTNEALTKIAEQHGVEPWAVIGGEDNTILGLGYGSSKNTGQKSLNFYKNNSSSHTLWHRHPKGGALWRGDYHAATLPGGVRTIVASGTNLMQGWTSNIMEYSMKNVTLQEYGNGQWDTVNRTLPSWEGN